uniref:AFG2 interacting ribosome maturation factor n=1 Tax=Equus caballus TaxID=9796 RepID=F6QY98_HORSE
RRRLRWPGTRLLRGRVRKPFPRWEIRTLSPRAPLEVRQGRAPVGRDGQTASPAKEALRQCFPVVEEQQGLWQSTLRDCQPLLASLGNLAEQLQAAQSLRFEDVPALRAFPDLKERLRRKQLAAGDTVLDKLGERLAALLKVRDTVSSHVERVLQIYEQHADTISIDAVLQASAVSPSVADMLEWLQDIERHYRNSYLKRKYLLSSIQWEDLVNIQALPKAWDQISEEEHQDLVQNVLLNVSFFLEE